MLNLTNWNLINYFSLYSLSFFLFTSFTPRIKNIKAKKIYAISISISLFVKFIIAAIKHIIAKTIFTTDATFFIFTFPINSNLSFSHKINLYLLIFLNILKFNNMILYTPTRSIYKMKLIPIICRQLTHFSLILKHKFANHATRCTLSFQLSLNLLNGRETAP